MLFSDDNRRALARVVDLVNTATSDADRLADRAGLDAFLAEHGVGDVAAVDPTDLAEVRRLRDRLRCVFTAVSDDEAATAVNDLLATAPVMARLSTHEGQDWHMHFRAPGSGVAGALTVDGGLALAEVLSRGERSRLRTCEAAGCMHVLVDLSRNRSRRYCDARTCGNRTHVAAYRERRRVVSC